MHRIPSISDAANFGKQLADIHEIRDVINVDMLNSIIRLHMWDFVYFRSLFNNLFLSLDIMHLNCEPELVV
jgi:hypothetical protein